MKKIIIIISIIALTYFIKIPPYVELNNLAIIESIGIEYKDDQYIVYLKELIPTKSDQGINYKYKYYEVKSNEITTAIEKIKKETSKKIYLSKIKKLITNLQQTDDIKKELDIKPNSIIHTDNIKDTIHQ